MYVARHHVPDVRGYARVCLVGIAHPISNHPTAVWSVRYVERRVILRKDRPHDDSS